MQLADRKRFLSCVEVAKELSVSSRTVWKWSTTGVIPRPIRLGGLRRWSTKELDEWLVAQAEARRRA